MTAPKKSGRGPLILIALIFAVPLAAATWLYYAGSSVRPEGRTNHGYLLAPVVNLPDELGGSALIEALENYWGLVYVSDGSCDEPCRDALYMQRQTRLMLGNDMTRVVRVLLHGPEAPDTLFLDQEQAGLKALRDPAAQQLLDRARPDGSSPGGFYLVDPLGNLVMYFPADIEPRDLVEDLEHLLDLSRIG